MRHRVNTAPQATPADSNALVDGSETARIATLANTPYALLKPVVAGAAITSLSRPARSTVIPNGFSTNSLAQIRHASIH